MRVPLAARVVGHAQREAGVDESEAPSGFEQQGVTDESPTEGLAPAIHEPAADRQKGRS